MANMTMLCKTNKKNNNVSPYHANLEQQKFMVGLRKYSYRSVANSRPIPGKEGTSCNQTALLAEMQEQVHPLL